MRPLRKLCTSLEIEARFTPRDKRSTGKAEDWPAGAKHYSARLKFQGREIAVEFTSGLPPTVEDLIASLVIDADKDERTARDLKFLFGLHLPTIEAAAADW